MKVRGRMKSWLRDLFASMAVEYLGILVSPKELVEKIGGFLWEREV